MFQYSPSQGAVRRFFSQPFGHCRLEAPLLGRLRPIALLLLLTIVLYPTDISFESTGSTNASGMVSVWSRLTIEMADAYSSLNERATEDCMRPKRVDCFSIQQNTWISDSTGNLVLWAQNAVELAKLGGVIYYGTFTFQVWSSSTAREPLLCKPESSRTAWCRAPFYTDPVPFPQSFIFYSHISSQGSKYVLQMSNNLGVVNWPLPASVKCPCHIETVFDRPLPWGSSPFEFVAVGLDSSAVAGFRNDTLGTFGPILVESDDGLWHTVAMDIIRCLIPTNCSGLLATGERSMNLGWNSTTREFHWSQGAFDQGASIQEVSEREVAAPAFPNPSIETYLYAELRSVYAYLTIFDGQRRALGIDPESGKRVEDIPNSSITHNSSEDLLIVNPMGQYELVITAGGNTAFGLFVSKTSNAGNDLGARSHNGTLNVGYSEHLHLNADNMRLSSEESVSTAYLLPVAGIVLALMGFIGIITTILFLRRKRLDD